MVRINLIEPKFLKDQHLIAEYNEILMLFGFFKKNPLESISRIPSEFVLGKGHILFFGNKLKYLRKRHEKIKSEMRKRGFKTEKTIELDDFPTSFKKDWKPREKDFRIIRKRLNEKIDKKPNWYRYYGKNGKGNKAA